MLYELFMLGTMWFWLLPVIIFIAVASALECESSGWAMTVFIIGLIVALLFSNLGVWVVANPILATNLVIGYLVGVPTWMWIKWEFYTSKYNRKYLDAKEHYYRLNSIADGPLPASYKKEFDIAIGSAMGHKDFPLRANSHKSLVLSWGINWPISLVWTFISDPVVRFAKSMFYGIANFLQTRSDAKAAKVMVRVEE